jgi:hypothetical protein
MEFGHSVGYTRTTPMVANTNPRINCRPIFFFLAKRSEQSTFISDVAGTIIPIYDGEEKSTAMFSIS